MKELKNKAKIEGRANRDDKMNLFALYYKENCTNGETLKDLKRYQNLPEVIDAIVRNPLYSQKIRLFINY